MTCHLCFDWPCILLDTAERRDFVKRVSALRCEAAVFLAMLNYTRRQVRELYRASGHGDSAVQAYRCGFLACILNLYFQFVN
jgi:hypothetical protein